MAERSRAWWATVGGALGATLAVRAGRWDALVAGWGGDPGALGAGVDLVVSVALSTTAGVALGLLVAHAQGRRGGGGVVATAAVLLGAGVALAAVPRLSGGDPGWALVGALTLLFVGPAVALLPLALTGPRSSR